MASLQASLARFSRYTSNLQPLQGHTLGIIGESIPQEMYLPGQNLVWTEADILQKLINRVTENLRAYSKLLGALDLCQQTLL